MTENPRIFNFQDLKADTFNIPKNANKVDLVKAFINNSASPT
ncbi:hypothetical protein [Okeania sp.]|nr:hypothetical protein [Okeania sp.]